MNKFITALLMVIAVAGSTLPASAYGGACGCGPDHPSSCPKR